MQRPGDSLSSTTYNIAKTPKALTTKPSGLILLQPVTQLDISSTSIRVLIHHKQNPRYLLPDSVLKIIQTEHLYQ